MRIFNRILQPIFKERLQKNVSSKAQLLAKRYKKAGGGYKQWLFQKRQKILKQWCKNKNGEQSLEKIKHYWVISPTAAIRSLSAAEYGNDKSKEKR